jgi:hypothetical protein
MEPPKTLYITLLRPKSKAGKYKLSACTIQILCKFLEVLLSVMPHNGCIEERLHSFPSFSTAHSGFEVLLEYFFGETWLTERSLSDGHSAVCWY